MAGVPRTKTAVRAHLAARGLTPRRLRGQHFLVDGNLVDAIVRQAAVGPGDAVLEVGTGTGILTDALADRAGLVLTCDVDARILELAREAREWPEHVVFLHADALAGKHRLNPDVFRRWRDDARARSLSRLRLVANLPYAIATPLLLNLLFQGVPIVDAVVMVQREAAERLVAPTGSADYGPATVAARLLASTRILRRVPPTVFWPAPRVESAVIRLEPRDPARARRLAREGLERLLREGFRHRRKVLRKAVDPARIAAAGLDPDVRPQEVDPAGWVRLLENAG